MSRPSVRPSRQRQSHRQCNGSPPPPPPPPTPTPLRAKWLSDYTTNHSDKFYGAPAQGGVWDALPKLTHSRAQSPAANAVVDLLPWPCRSQREWTSRRTEKHSRHHSCSTAYCRTDVLRLTGFSNFWNMNRLDHHSIVRWRGKKTKKQKKNKQKNREKKWPPSHAPRSGTTCVQSTLGTSFEGNRTSHALRSISVVERRDPALVSKSILWRHTEEVESGQGRRGGGG